jgi:hypothetical protein
MYKIIGGDRKEYGPVSADEVQHWISEGRLNGQSMAWVEGSTEWRPLASFPEFTEALGAQVGSAVPPPGTPMPPVSAEMWTAQMLAREPRVKPLECIALSWNLLKRNFGLLFTASFLVWLVSTVSGFVPFGGFLYTALKGVFYGGLYLVFLNTIRGKPTGVADVFSGFNIAFVHLVLAALLSWLLSFLFLCCLIVPGVYLFVAWTFAVPLVADRRLEFWSAMELSRKVVSRVWFEIFGLLLLAFLPAILTFMFVEIKVSATMYSAFRDIFEAGRPDFNRIMALMYQIAKTNIGLFLFLKLIVLLNFPFAVGALMYAYENLFGTRTERTS